MKKLLARAALLSMMVTAHAMHGDRAEARAPRARTCPKPSAADILCRNRGVVSVTAPGQGAAAVAARRGTAVHYGSLVHVGSGGKATALFARQASCNLGGRHVTDLVTRYGDNNPLTNAAPLFWQQRGDAACSFHRRVTSSTQFFCESSGECPLTVYTDGTHVSDAVPRDVVSVGRVQADARAAQGATTTVSHTKVIIDFCAGSYVIDYVDGSGEHHRDVDAGDGEDEHVHVEISETHISTTSSGNGDSTTTLNDDGSTTTTTTTPDGSTTTTTTNPDGSIKTVVIDANGSTTTTVTSGDGSNSTTVVSGGNGSPGTATASGESLSMIVSSVSGDGACAVFD